MVRVHEDPRRHLDGSRRNLAGACRAPCSAPIGAAHASNARSLMLRRVVLQRRGVNEDIEVVVQFDVPDGRDCVDAPARQQP